ncbi:hypothetical protein Phi46:1_gp43 [Cellulophaga phage phi46:1]|uniref:hypothetical protein n=1 Tax=Cellulophaga phage phi46:1 TaxID=1327974 RepID=UPI000351F863|nr:hypothetical protein Phi46:1_gp43 [Cellulophaga phage phi46:1]AGO47854.1 hypothetical protein Phi46:1_gp43 [Cellulophaga phage phi46:1]
MTIKTTISDELGDFVRNASLKRYGKVNVSKFIKSLLNREQLDEAMRANAMNDDSKKSDIITLIINGVYSYAFSPVFEGRRYTSKWYRNRETAAMVKTAFTIEAVKVLQVEKMSPEVFNSIIKNINDKYKL